MSCQHHDFLSEELASLSVQEPVSPRLAKGYSPEGNWPALFHLSLFFICYCLSAAPTLVCIHNNNKNNNNNNNKIRTAHAQSYLHNNSMTAIGQFRKRWQARRELQRQDEFEYIRDRFCSYWGPDKQIDWFQQKGLIARNKVCPSCGL